jgi:hypothetical protein
MKHFRWATQTIQHPGSTGKGNRDEGEGGETHHSGPAREVEDVPLEVGEFHVLRCDTVPSEHERRHRVVDECWEARVEALCECAAGLRCG